MNLLLRGIIALLMVASPTFAAADGVAAFNGSWVLNLELSDDPDKAVEKAIKKGGGKVKRGKKERGHYRGGPATQALYDHLSYDEELHFQYQQPEFRLTYEQGFERVFYSDGRRRVVSTKNLVDRTDYSFAGWEGEVLYVESKPMDSGYIMETYTLINEGSQLQVQLQLEPATFAAPIKMKLVYDRKPASE